MAGYFVGGSASDLTVLFSRLNVGSIRLNMSALLGMVKPTSLSKAVRLAYLITMRT